MTAALAAALTFCCTQGNVVMTFDPAILVDNGNVTHAPLVSRRLGMLERCCCSVTLPPLVASRRCVWLWHHWEVLCVVLCCHLPCIWKDICALTGVVSQCTLLLSSTQVDCLYIYICMEHHATCCHCHFNLVHIATASPVGCFYFQFVDHRVSRCGSIECNGQVSRNEHVQCHHGQGMGLAFGLASLWKTKTPTTINHCSGRIMQKMLPGEYNAKGKW